MIRALIGALSWLDKRFPPVVTVTKEAFAALQENQYRIRKDYGTLCDERKADSERISQAEKSISAIKELLSKSGSTMLIPEAQRRANFIAAGRMAE